MANVTDPLIKSVEGSDPQNLMEYITRQKIYDSRFWKEECFGLTAADVLERAAQSLTCVGGTFGGMGKPTRFLSLTLKLLQLKPDLELVRTFLEQNHFKYLRALGAFYLRLTGRPQDIYELLDPLYADYSRLRYRGATEWKVLHVDEFVDDLLNEAFCCGIAMPRLPARETLQEAGYLDEGPRPTALREALMEAGGIEEYLRRKVDEELRRRKSADASGGDNGGGSGSGSGSGAIALWEKRYGPLQPTTQPPTGDGVGVDNHAPSRGAGAALPAAAGGTIDIQNNNNDNNDNDNDNHQEGDTSTDLGAEFRGSEDAAGKRKAADEPADAAEAKRKKKKKDKKKSEKYGTLFKKSSASDGSKRHAHRNSSNDGNGNDSNSNSKRSVDETMGGEDGSDSHKAAAPAAAAAAEEHSEEYWNKLRSSLGMNPLKK